MYRLFIAADPPPEVKKQLLEICYGLPGAKWTDESRMHITLRFLGEVDGGKFKDARAALNLVQFEPFEITVRGVGCFPLRKRPEILWAGIDGNDKLVQLRNRIEAALDHEGLGRESRKFHPHVQLAKVKDTPPEKVAQYLTEFSLLRLPPFQLTEFHLYSSFLSSERALHKIEESYTHWINGSVRA
jgi:2'-5' RNA ligase